jgi:alkyl sulfatase BDS1-like metallo-beta-lactamase superfamily hydrolase
MLAVFAYVAVLAFVSVVFFALSWAQDVSYKANYPARYMGADANIITAPNGARIYDEALKAVSRIVYTEPTVQNLGDGVWIIGGYSIANFSVIEAPEGLIVYDTGDYAEEGKRLRQVIEEKISKKPIKAIIYSHSHYALAGGALVDDASTVTVIGHPKLNETVKTNLEGGGAPSAIPELGPVLTARAGVQFSNFLPLKGEDATIAARIKVKEPAFLPVNTPVRNKQKLTVAGLELQFFTEHISDDHNVTVWIPDKRVALNNFFWPGTPNLYSLRGAVYRDPTVWRDGLKVIRDLQPRMLLSTHARAVVGETEVAKALTAYMDLITLTYDQTIRGILHGLGPDDLRYFIYKPRHLAEAPNNAEVYGETPWYPPAVFYFQMGWFDRDVTKLWQLPPKEEAKRLVNLMGGRDKVIAAANDALNKKEYAWAAQLVNYLYTLNPGDAEARKIKAQALRKLGQLSMGSIGRAFLISEARALEGMERIPKLVPPRPELIAQSPTTFVNYHRVRIDPRQAESVDQVIVFDFGDKGRAGLHVRRGVAEFLSNPGAHYHRPDIVVSMSGESWAKLYLNRSDLASLIDAGKAKMTKGDLKSASSLLNLFDVFEPARNVTIPTAYHR